MTPKGVIFDIDGTLTESKQAMTHQMGETLATLIAKVPVGIFSGGGLPQFKKQFLTALPPDTKRENLYLFPTSAAQCFTYEGGTLVPKYQHLLSPEEKEKIVAALTEGVRETHFIDDSTPSYGERIEDRSAQITFSALGQQAPWSVKATWDPTREKRAPLAAFLAARLPEYTIAMNASTSIDITHKGINKASGVQAFARMLGVPVSELLYVGDALFPGGNDAVVIPTGIPTRPVTGPSETLQVIAELVSALS